MTDFKPGDHVYLDSGGASYVIAEVLRFTDDPGLWATITNPDWPKGRTVKKKKNLTREPGNAPQASTGPPQDPQPQGSRS